MNFGEKLVQLRKGKGMSQEDLAVLLKTTRQAVSKWENNQGYPETDKILLLSHIFEVSTDVLLKEEKMIVTKAWNGREAVEIFENSEPGYFDVILMDLMMPQMGGLEATRRIRKLDRRDAKTIPIFAMTANAFLDDIAQSKAAGMNEHFSKPLQMEKVIDAIRFYYTAR